MYAQDPKLFVSYFEKGINRVDEKEKRETKNDILGRFHTLDNRLAQFSLSHLRVKNKHRINKENHDGKGTAQDVGQVVAKVAPDVVKCQLTKGHGHFLPTATARQRFAGRTSAGFPPDGFHCRVARL